MLKLSTNPILANHAEPSLTTAIRNRTSDVRERLTELTEALERGNPPTVQAARLLLKLDKIHSELLRVANPIINPAGKLV